jgi:hypothetical protein
MTLTKNTFATITYHLSSDTYTGRTCSWMQSVLSYNSDPMEHFVISLTYGYGNSETTGNNTSQIKLGLAAKF